MTTKNKPTCSTLFKHEFISFDNDGRKVFNLYEGHSLKIVYSNDFKDEKFDEIRLVKQDRECPHSC